MHTIHPGLVLSNRNFSMVLSHRCPSKVILSIPHDCLAAGDFSDFFQERQSGVMVRDLHAWPIANGVVHRSSLLDVRVDAIRFLVPRPYVDANRALIPEDNLDPVCDESALDDPRLLSAYQGYHREIHRLIGRSVRKFGAENILLLDLHGFGRQPAIAPESGFDLILGTANRKTIHHGTVDIEIATFLRRRSYEVFLPDRNPVVSDGDPFDAGQITRLYAAKYGINAIQVEISQRFRRKESKERGEKLAVDIAEFLAERYK